MRGTYAGTRPSALFGTKYVQGVGRQVDWDLIPASYRQGAVKVIIGANAAQNDTTISLTVPAGKHLSKGEVLDFGSGKFAKLGEAVIGTGSEVANIDVEALVTALVDGDIAYVGGTGPKFIPACTIMQKLTGGKMIPMALVTKTYSATRTADAGNTGNGVMTLHSTTPVLAGAQVGTYRVVFIEPASNLGTFVVFAPDGHEVGEGVVGTEFATEIKFTIADGATDFVAGDAISVVVAQTDGSDCCGLILTDATENSLTDSVTGYGLAVSGVVFENLLPDAVGGVITATQKAALNGVAQGWLFETYQDTRA